MSGQNERGGRQPELHAGPAQPRRVGVQPGDSIDPNPDPEPFLFSTDPTQVKTGLGEAMEGIGEDLLEEYKKAGDARK